jgi:hypothetical protein
MRASCFSLPRCSLVSVFVLCELNAGSNSYLHLPTSAGLVWMAYGADNTLRADGTLQAHATRLATMLVSRRVHPSTEELFYLLGVSPHHILYLPWPPVICLLHLQSFFSQNS